jgi:hypothetical protein
MGRGKKRFVLFTNQRAWEPISDSEFVVVLGRLGEDGWEMVSSRLEGDGAEAWYFKAIASGIGPSPFS